MLHFFAKRLNELHSEDRKGEKGFTLIELLVVVIIIGILAAIAIPTFLGQRARAQDANAKSMVRNGATAVEAQFTDNGQKYSTITDTELEAIEPSIDFTKTGTVAEDKVDYASLGDPSASASGGYTLSTKSKSGKTVVYKKDATSGKTTVTVS